MRLTTSLFLLLRHNAETCSYGYKSTRLARGLEESRTRVFVAEASADSEGGDYPFGAHHQRHLEAVDPLGLRTAPPEARLTSEQPFTAGPRPHDRRDEGRIHHPVSFRRVGELAGQPTLERPQLGLQSADRAVELVLAHQAREVGAEVRLGEAPEVPLAAEAGPLGEDGEREDFARREQGGASGLQAIRGPLASALVVHEHVQ